MQNSVNGSFYVLDEVGGRASGLREKEATIGCLLYDGERHLSVLVLLDVTSGLSIGAWTVHKARVSTVSCVARHNPALFCCDIVGEGTFVFEASLTPKTPLCLTKPVAVASRSMRLITDWSRAIDAASSCMEHISMAGLLCLGYSNGAFCIMSLAQHRVLFSDEELLDSGRVVAFMLQEPEDDPKPVLYLWVVTQLESGVDLRMFQVLFSAKKPESDDGIAYKGFGAADQVYRQFLGGASYISGSPISRRITDEHAEQRLDTTLLGLSYARNNDAYVQLFDLNAWYAAHMPSDAARNVRYNFFATATLDFDARDADSILDVWIDPSSVRGKGPELAGLTFDVKGLTKERFFSLTVKCDPSPSSRNTLIKESAPTPTERAKSARMHALSESLREGKSDRLFRGLVTMDPVFVTEWLQREAQAVQNDLRGLHKRFVAVGNGAVGPSESDLRLLHGTKTRSTHLSALKTRWTSLLENLPPAIEEKLAEVGSVLQINLEYSRLLAWLVQRGVLPIPSFEPELIGRRYVKTREELQEPLLIEECLDVEHGGPLGSYPPKSLSELFRGLMSPRCPYSEKLLLIYYVLLDLAEVLDDENGSLQRACSDFESEYLANVHLLFPDIAKAMWLADNMKIEPCIDQVFSAAQKAVGKDFETVADFWEILCSRCDVSTSLFSVFEATETVSNWNGLGETGRKALLCDLLRRERFADVMNLPLDRGSENLLTSAVEDALDCSANAAAHFVNLLLMARGHLPTRGSLPSLASESLGQFPEWLDGACDRAVLESYKSLIGYVSEAPQVKAASLAMLAATKTATRKRKAEAFSIFGVSTPKRVKLLPEAKDSPTKRDLMDISSVLSALDGLERSRPGSPGTPQLAITPISGLSFIATPSPSSISPAGRVTRPLSTASPPQKGILRTTKPDTPRSAKARVLTFEEGASTSSGEDKVQDTTILFEDERMSLDTIQEESPEDVTSPQPAFEPRAYPMYQRSQPRQEISTVSLGLGRKSTPQQRPSIRAQVSPVSGSPAAGRESFGSRGSTGSEKHLETIPESDQEESPAPASRSPQVLLLPARALLRPDRASPSAFKPADDSHVTPLPLTTKDKEIQPVRPIPCLPDITSDLKTERPVPRPRSPIPPPESTERGPSGDFELSFSLPSVLSPSRSSIPARILKDLAPVTFSPPRQVGRQPLAEAKEADDALDDSVDDIEFNDATADAEVEEVAMDMDEVPFTSYSEDGDVVDLGGSDDNERSDVFLDQSLLSQSPTIPTSDDTREESSSSPSAELSYDVLFDSSLETDLTPAVEPFTDGIPASSETGGISKELEMAAGEEIGTTDGQESPVKISESEEAPVAEATTSKDASVATSPLEPTSKQGDDFSVLISPITEESTVTSRQANPLRKNQNDEERTGANEKAEEEEEDAEVLALHAITAVGTAATVSPRSKGDRRGSTGETEVVTIRQATEAVTAVELPGVSLMDAGKKDSVVGISEGMAAGALVTVALPETISGIDTGTDGEATATGRKSRRNAPETSVGRVSMADTGSKIAKGKEKPVKDVAETTPRSRRQLVGDKPKAPAKVKPTSPKRDTKEVAKQKKTESPARGRKKSDSISNSPKPSPDRSEKMKSAKMESPARKTRSNKVESPTRNENVSDDVRKVSKPTSSPDGKQSPGAGAKRPAGRPRKVDRLSGSEDSMVGISEEMAVGAVATVALRTAASSASKKSGRTNAKTTAHEDEDERAASKAPSPRRTRRTTSTEQDERPASATPPRTKSARARASMSPRSVQTSPRRRVSQSPKAGRRSGTPATGVPRKPRTSATPVRYGLRTRTSSTSEGTGSGAIPSRKRRATSEVGASAPSPRRSRRLSTMEESANTSLTLRTRKRD